MTLTDYRITDIYYLSQPDKELFRKLLLSIAPFFSKTSYTQPSESRHANMQYSSRHNKWLSTALSSKDPTITAQEALAKYSKPKLDFYF